jgi:hypothetical protein
MDDCHTIIVRREFAVWTTIQAVCMCGRKTGEMAFTLFSQDKPTIEAAEAVLKMLHAD